MKHISAIFFLISSIESLHYQGSSCLAPFCRNEGTCIDNFKSIQGYNCVCAPGYFGETCDRHYLNCNDEKTHSGCLPASSLEKSFVYKDICYKLVSELRTYENAVEYCLENRMIPALIKINDTLNQIWNHFKEAGTVYIGFHSENFRVTWYDSTPVRFDPVKLSETQCGVLNVDSEAIHLSPCHIERKFICQKNIDCQDKTKTEYVSPCASNPCINNGICAEQNQTSYKCLCEVPFGGARCIHEIVQVNRNRSCNIAGYLYYNQNCYKLHNMNMLDLNWIDTVCFDEESELLHEINSNSAGEILFLISLIDKQTTDFSCIVTKITTNTFNIIEILEDLTRDPRIKYDHELGQEGVLFICIADITQSVTAFLQFRSFNDSTPDQLYFACKERKIKDDGDNNPNKSKPICQYPELGRNAFLNYNQTTQVIEYSCFDDMYPLPNTNFKIQCLGSNQWSGRALECDFLKCPPPPLELKNAVLVANVSNLALYDCREQAYAPKTHVGYSFTLKCVNYTENGATVGKWNGTNICTETIPCPYPIELVHGNMSVDENQVIYTCPNGSVYRGYCTSKGEWSIKPPNCQHSRCGYPKVYIANAKMNLTGFQVGATVSFSCVKNFRAVNKESSVSVCLGDSNWSEIQLKCIEVLCEFNISVKNARVVYSGNKPDDHALVICSFGYRLNFERVFFVCEDGVWRLSESVNLECQYLSCPKPNISTNDVIRTRTDLSRGINHFESVEFECQRGHELVGARTIMCLPDGTWSDNFPSCKISYCESPPYFPNTESNYTQTTVVGDIIVYSCRPGFEMEIPEGETWVGFECNQNRKWIGLGHIKCSLSSPKCPRPEPIENGYFIYDGLYMGSKATYKCNINFVLIGDETRTCLRNQTWSGLIPSCHPYKCPPLEEIANGRIEFDHYQAVYYCDHGYDIAGESERICLRSLQWSGQSPKCLPRLCPHLDDLENGHVTVSSYGIHGTASYSCQQGYDLVDGTKTRVCLSNKMWTGKAPVCKRINFVLSRVYLDERNIQIGLISWPNTRSKREVAPATSPLAFNKDDIYFYDEFVSLHCDNSSKKASPPQTNRIEVRTRADLERISSLSCEQIECPPITASNLSENVVIIQSVGFKYGNYVSFGCKIGYNLNSGSSVRICGEDGEWSGQFPKCSLVFCGMPKSGKNSFWKFGETATVAYYYCNRGYREVEGDHVRSCWVDPLDHKIKWKGSPLSCELLSCNPLNLTNATAEIPSFQFGSLAYLQCKPGYRAVKGNFIRICSETGAWSGEELICRSITEYMDRLKQQYSLRITSSKAFGGIAIGFIVSLFVVTCIVDFRWSLVVLVYEKFRGHSMREPTEMEHLNPNSLKPPESEPRVKSQKRDPKSKRAKKSIFFKNTKIRPTAKIDH